MYIEYVGFSEQHDPRIYNFDVIDAKESRHFTVEVRLREGPWEEVSVTDHLD